MNSDFWDGTIMKKMVILLTGGIGSGKSTLARLVSDTIPCYDSDSAVKSFYVDSHNLLSKVESALGRSFRKSDGSFDSKALAQLIFNDAASLAIVESIIYPPLMDDFAKWRDEKFLTCDIVLFESATAFYNDHSDKCWDKCIYIDAPKSIRVVRVCERSGCTEEEALRRMNAQQGPERYMDKIDAIVENDSSPEILKERFMDALNKICGK